MSSPAPFARRATTRLATVGALSAAGVLALALPAAAHVSVGTVGPATQGGFAVLDVQVPSESDTASTIKVDLTFATPVASASPQPVPGWTVAITKAKLPAPVETDDGTISEGVGRIVWTASGTTAKDGVPPGQFQQFFVDAGPLPSTATMAFRAIQTYSDGEVVKWIEPTLPGQSEPQHPAPVLSLTAAGAAAGGPTTPATPTPTAPGTTAAAKDSSARALGIAGIALGAVGLVLGGLGARRRTT